MEAKEQQTSQTGKKPNNESGEVLINVNNIDRDQENVFQSRELDASRFSKPPQIPNNEGLTRRRSMSRPTFSKSKSRFGIEYPVMIEEESKNLNLSRHEEEIIEKSYSYRSSFNRGSPSNASGRSIRTNSIRSKAASAVEDDEEAEIYRKVEMINKEKQRRVSFNVLVQFGALFLLCGFLVASLTIEKLKKKMIWGLEIWKWTVVVLVTFCGMLVTNWFIQLVVFVIERNFLLRKKVLYFVHGLKRSVQTFIWIGLILIAWVILFEERSQQGRKARRILHYVTWTLASLLIGSFLWLLKTFLLKLLSSNFQRKTFFDRIQESVFHQYILQTLAGPPVIEEAVREGRVPMSGLLNVGNMKKGKETKEKKLIDIGKLYKMKQEKVSSWTMKVLVDAVVNSGSYTISNTIDESISNSQGGQTEITNEMEAIAFSYHIFRNVAKPGAKYIEEEDLLRFMIKEEVDHVFPLFEGHENGRIDRKALINWVINAYNGRKTLAHALNDTKTAVKQLNSLVTAVLIIATIIIWFLLVEIASTRVILVILSQIALIQFMFGSTCRSIFESIIFVFVMHPFDVGDRCVVDGMTLMVEEMNLLTTVFLKITFEKIYYPNSVLSTKVITNYYRSPDQADPIEFGIDFATTAAKIASLREKIKEYLERTPQYWHPVHYFVVNEIENVNKLKITLYPIHTMNFQNFAERNRRKTELILEIKGIFEELDIKYHLLPQKVLLEGHI